MEVYVLDRQMQPVPLGVTGELYISGTGLARGYIKQPDLTEAAFIPSPWQSGARLYRTGDLAAWLPDGNLDYIGRIDSQVKIRGFRIEPSEIETLIAQIPGVEQAIVALQKNDMEDARLVAYFTSTGAAPNAATIRVSLRQKLPEFMIPADFVRVRQFLLTPSGKIDRRNLPNLGDIEPEIAEGYTAPRNSLEQKIADIWKEVLRREKVGINDNFFDLGGHSLLIFKVHSKLQRLGKKHIAITDLFRYPTVTSLAQFCAAGDIHKSVRQKRNAAIRA
jgi:acyl carrier protein